ncbi:unnamed protein product [Lymnaea stagnalis]|uniref:Uncharacterized protein n=1 Tax=Lymnaea stagnalis TaxID=6523 RepID=A0AAV2I531_LYMST
MCAFKDELRAMGQSGEDATEITAMAPHGVMGPYPDEGSSYTTRRERGKAWFKKLKSPKGICLAVTVSAILVVVAAYLLAKISVGALYIQSCQVDPFIPIYLVVSGSLLLMVIIIITILVLVKLKDEEVNDNGVSSVHLTAFVYFFIHLVLQLAGSVCVIRTRNEMKKIAETTQMTNTTTVVASALCDQTLITFSFGVVLFELVISCLMFILVILSIAEVIYLVCCQVSPVTKPATNNR